MGLRLRPMAIAYTGVRLLCALLSLTWRRAARPSVKPERQTLVWRLL